MLVAAFAWKLRTFPHLCILHVQHYWQLLKILLCFSYVYLVSLMCLWYVPYDLWPSDMGTIQRNEIILLLIFLVTCWSCNLSSMLRSLQSVRFLSFPTVYNMPMDLLSRSGPVTATLNAHRHYFVSGAKMKEPGSGVGQTMWCANYQKWLGHQSLNPTKYVETGKLHITGQ